jgi:hypothetical protein
MKFELIRSWRANKPGDILDMQPGVVELLVRRGIAKLLTGKKARKKPTRDKSVKEAPNIKHAS